MAPERGSPRACRCVASLQAFLGEENRRSPRTWCLSTGVAPARAVTVRRPPRNPKGADNSGPEASLSAASNNPREAQGVPSGPAAPGVRRTRSRHDRLSIAVATSPRDPWGKSQIATTLRAATPEGGGSPSPPAPGQPGRVEPGPAPAGGCLQHAATAKSWGR
jgi:hypothetical protein